MRFLDRFRSRPAGRVRRLRRRAGLRTWTRALGTAGLSAEAEEWILGVEESLRRAEPRIRDELRRA
jgi:hypothetical protein